jgi:amino acid adenylation domain-containing protein
VNDATSGSVLSCDDVLRIRSHDCSDATAIICAAGALTYRQLECRVALLAALLIEHGCLPGDRLALLLGPGQATVIAMLAALRAGLVYVPIDPTWPRPRCHDILQDAGARLVLMETRDASAPPAGAAVLRHDFTRETNDRFARQAYPPWSPAYILFTSGSTGKPKGIVQSRAGMAGHAAHYARSITLAQGERIALLAQYCCDAAVMDVFGALHAGACLCIFDPRGANAGTLAAWLRESRTAVCHMTPTLYRTAFRADASPLGLPALRCVVLGGEAVFESDVKRHFSLFPDGVELINGYGPTECTLALQQRVLPSTAMPDGKVPVGTTFADIAVTLVDAQGRPVAPGAAGEIVLSGRHVALGYWPLDPLRRDAFSAGPAEAERSFSTGDLALRQADGSHVHLGRADHQVKIAGHRVELGEIEASVLALPGIGSAAVIAGGVATGMRIGCWFVPADARAPDAAGLRQALSARLPPFMVPAHIVAVPAMPLLTSGKIDRKALIAELEGRAPDLRNEASLEDRMAAIWAQVLGDHCPSRHDNFFAAGGDSLQAIQIELLVEKQMAVASPSLFRFPTIARMAAALDGGGRIPARPTAPPATMAGLTPPQRRYWARPQQARDSTAFNIGIVVEIDGALDLPVFVQAFNCVIAGNDVFRLGIREGDGGPLPMYGSLGRIDGLSLRTAPGLCEAAWNALVERLAREQLDTAFDLRRSGLFRALLITRGSRHALLMTFHHLIMDAWSRRLFERELVQAYLALGADRGWTGAPRPRYLDAMFPDVDGLDATALERLSRPYRMPPMTLPSRGTGGDGAAEAHGALSGPLAAALDRFARDNGLSLFAVLASLSGLALAWWCGSPYAVATVDRLNRRAADLDVIGLFSDVAPLLFEWTGDLPFCDLASCTHRDLGLINSAGAPSFSDLMERLRPGSLADYDAAFPVALALEEPPQPIPTSGLHMVSREIPGAQISRDLILVLTKAPHGCALTLLYRAERFSADAPNRLIAGLESIAQRLADSVAAGRQQVTCGNLLASCPAPPL